MCINCESGGFHTEESLNDGTLSDQVLSRRQHLANNLVDDTWVNYIKQGSDFLDDNKIDMHVSDDIPQPFKTYAKRMIRKINRQTETKIKLTKVKEQADILVDDVDNYDEFGIDDANGLAFASDDGKLNATWLSSENTCDYNNRRGKCKVWNYTKTLITHEILHTLGISHPFGNGNTEGYNNTDTAMSYNFFDYGIKNPLRPADVMALQSIWG
tara:strand:- start:99 stop:737 length:639 start_codon:yes stop_codon:yes gene_type:complete